MFKGMFKKIGKIIASGLVLSSCLFANVGAVPHVIFGTWQTGSKTYELVISAIKAGIRHIDTAQSYGNEHMVGAAVRQCIQEGIIKREDIRVTTKIMPEEVVKKCSSPIKYTYDAVSELIDESLTRLGLGYIDTVLIHEEDPVNGFEIWQSLAEYKTKNPRKVRKIGLSNYMYNWSCDQIIRISKPDVIQNPFFPGSYIVLDNNDIYYDWKKHENIEFEGYKPIGHGLLINNFFVKELAKKYNVNPASICLQYCLLNRISPVFSSTNPEHIFDNIRGVDSINFDTEDSTPTDMESDDTSVDEIDKLDSCLPEGIAGKIIYGE